MHMVGDDGAVVPVDSGDKFAREEMADHKLGQLAIQNAIHELHARNGANTTGQQHLALLFASLHDITHYNMRASLGNLLFRAGTVLIVGAVIEQHTLVADTVGRHIVVTVNKHHIVSLALLKTRLAGCARTDVLDVEHTHPRVGIGIMHRYIMGAVSRAVINDNNLAIGINSIHHRAHSGVQPAFGVKCGYDN